MSDYLEVAEAIALSGLRLVLTRGIPGPWGEAAKGILHVKRIAHARVAQEGGGENAALKAWTGLNTAPIAIYGDEPPRDQWTQILMLAERLAQEPRLIPENEADRALMFGLSHELCGEDGYGWNRRLMFFASWEQSLATATDPTALGRESYDRMRRKYGYGTLERARARIVAVLSHLGERLQHQRRAGSPYYIGERLTALDIYSACFVAMVRPLPLELCPMSEAMHAAYAERDPAILAAVDPILLEHRDEIYRRHLELPLRL